MLSFDEPRVSYCNIFAIGKNEQGSNRENHYNNDNGHESKERI